LLFCSGHDYVVILSLILFVLFLLLRIYDGSLSVYVWLSVGLSCVNLIDRSCTVIFLPNVNSIRLCCWS